MAFEEFTKKAARAAGTPYITIQKRGVFSLNHAAFVALGEPKAVSLLFDSERQLVGFRSSDPESDHSYAVRLNSKGTSHLVTGALFTTHYEISTETSRRWKAQMVEDGILAIDISTPAQQPIPPATRVRRIK